MSRRSMLLTAGLTALAAVLTGFTAWSWPALRAHSRVATPAAVQIAHSDMLRIGSALEKYRSVYYENPPCLSLLETGTMAFRRGFLEEVPMDPWGRPYLYRLHGHSYLLRSVGPDGILNTADDVPDELDPTSIDLGLELR